MKKIKKIKNLEDYHILKQWVEGATLAEIGNKLNGVSRQGVSQMLSKEEEKVYVEQKFDVWLRSIITNKENKKLYPFLSFKGFPHGKFYTYMLKKHFNYHIVDGEYATLEKLDVQKIRTAVISAIKKHGLPMPIALSPEDNQFAFDDISFFAGEKTWDKFFYTSKEKGVPTVLAFKGETLLYNVCEWLKKDKNISVEEVFKKMPKELKAKSKATNKDKFISFLKERKNYLYEFEEDVKNKLLLFIGVEVGKRSS